MTCDVVSMSQCKKDCQLTIDLLETNSNSGSFDGHADDCQQKWSTYIDRFVASDDVPMTYSSELTSQPVLLHRYHSGDCDYDIRVLLCSVAPWTYKNTDGTARGRTKARNTNHL